MDFNAGSLRKSSRAALAGAFVASAALLFALLTGEAEAELITPEAATPPPVTVPGPANAATAPAPQASPGAPSQPASAGASQGEQLGSNVDNDGSPGDAPSQNPDQIVSRTFELQESLSMSTLLDHIAVVEESIRDFRGSVLHYFDDFRQYNELRDPVKELIANAEAANAAIKALVDDIQNSQPKNPAPPGPDAGAPKPGDDQTGDPSSGPDADPSAPNSANGSGAPNPDGAGGNGSGGGNGGGGESPDDEPNLAAE